MASGSCSSIGWTAASAINTASEPPDAIRSPMCPGKCPGSSKAVTPSASSVSPPICSKSTDAIVRATCGLSVVRAKATPSRCAT